MSCFPSHRINSKQVSFLSAICSVDNSNYRKIKAKVAKTFFYYFDEKNHKYKLLIFNVNRRFDDDFLTATLSEIQKVVAYGCWLVVAGKKLLSMFIRCLSN